MFSPLMVTSANIASRGTSLFYLLNPTNPQSKIEISTNHFVRPHQHVRRNRQADLLGGFQIDDELELRRLLHRKISGLGAFEDFVHIVAARRNKSGVFAP